MALLHTPSMLFFRPKKSRICPGVEYIYSMEYIAFSVFNGHARMGFGVSLVTASTVRGLAASEASGPSTGS